MIKKTSFCIFFISIFSLLSLSFINTAEKAFAEQLGDIDPVAQRQVCVDLKNNLRQGSRDALTNGEVSLLQDFLQSKGYLPFEPTGYFGLLTKNAVLVFQKDALFSPTGYVGPLTRGKIKEIACSGVSISTSATSTPNGIVATSTQATTTPVSEGISTLLQNVVNTNQAIINSAITILNKPGKYSYMVPTGVTSIKVTGTGGGGGGFLMGPNPSGTWFYSGAGGGGVISKTITVTPGETLTVVVGVGGPANGSAGGTTYLKRGSTDLVTLGGGVGGGFSKSVGGAGPLVGQAGISQACGMKSKPLSGASASAVGSSYGYGGYSNCDGGSLAGGSGYLSITAVPVVSVTTPILITPSINIISPIEGRYLYRGGNLDVSWSTTGVPDGDTNQILIRLRNTYTNQEYNLATSRNDFSENIIIPANIPNDTYFLEIKTSVNNQSYVATSGVYPKEAFKVVDAGVTETPTPTAPTCSVSASKENVVVDEPYTLTWTSNASYMMGLPTETTWPASGSQVVSSGMLGTKTYTLVFYGQRGLNTTCTKTINTVASTTNAQATTSAVSTVLGVYQGYMNGSQTPFITTNSISKQYAIDNCTLNHNNNPAASIKCTWNGVVVYSFTPQVIPNPIINSFSASPTSIVAGNSAKLSFSAANTAGCDIKAMSGVVAPTVLANTDAMGTGNITQSTTYQLTCTPMPGATGGSVTKSVTVTVTPVPLPTLTLTASPTSVAYNGSSKISWVSTNATSCAFGDKQQLINDSSIIPNITSKTTYTMTCTGAGGSVTKSVTVNVIPFLPPIITASPSTGTFPLKVVFSTSRVTCTGNAFQLVYGDGAIEQLLWTCLPIGEQVSGTQYYYHTYKTANTYSARIQELKGTVWTNVASTVISPPVVEPVIDYTNIGATVINSQRTNAPEVTSVPSTQSNSLGKFTEDLYRGVTGEEVIALQEALTKDGFFSGEISGNFYDHTVEAVKAFQVKYGINSTGYVGQTTRAKLNELYGR